MKLGSVDASMRNLIRAHGSSAEPGHLDRLRSMPQLAIEERQWLDKAPSLFVGLRNEDKGSNSRRRWLCDSLFPGSGGLARLISRAFGGASGAKTSSGDESAGGNTKEYTSPHPDSPFLLVITCTLQVQSPFEILLASVGPLVQQI